jgi:type IV secretory pathway VirD2 relaxase
LTDSSNSPIYLAIRDLADTMVFKFESLRDELREVKRRMADLNQSVEDLRGAVNDVAVRVGELTGPLQEQIRVAVEALAAEREAAAALAASEDAEDVQQNADLADARARVDAALADAQSAADNIEGEVARLNQVAAPAPEA